VQRIVIFGNSGSGKTTLARQRAAALRCPHLDLDTVAWAEDCAQPTRRALEDSAREIEGFLEESSSWVVEGCYADLLELVIPQATEIVFLNPGREICQENCRQRPWEPHKYATPEEQDANLGMLLEWVAGYEVREDEFSLGAHRELFEGYRGVKMEVTAEGWGALGDWD
jgi:adenylate kinase family enzyme